ncbi:allophanate hydrolase [Kineosporia sp. R_H_3]|uniref:allophanate hydrolase n=1 Tax=Kineosporia sp. R_H_3 TaxID=1961848 RepID=UPI000B4BC6B1|nr:allophanate hydrolase [Kineosporia sp. R_H_3]
MTTASPGPTPGPSVADLRAAFAAGATTPARLVDDVLARIAGTAADHAWISVAPRAALLARAGQVDAALPLAGVPIGVKDSIDVAGLPTTNGCPAYAYTPAESATAVRRAEAAGALVVGKHNLDQFATGLVGTRSPYGRGESVYGQGMISGGSSSGSALAVARGVVPVAIATDTAGSGRVPAALNGIVGIKPTRGITSTVGLVPACRTLDCVTVMGARLADALTLLAAIAGPDDAEPWGPPRRLAPPPPQGFRPRIGLPATSTLEFFGDGVMAAAHLAARADAVARLGADGVEIDLTPFTAAGDLLYEGPWVGERLAVFGDFMDAHPGEVEPVVEQVIRSGARFSAVDAYAALYRLQDLRHAVAPLWRDVDTVLVPTVGTTFTQAQVDADPVRRNLMLGRYTQSGNLLDLAGIALPLGTTPDGRPLGITLLGPAGSDLTLAAIAARLLDEPAAPGPVVLDLLADAGLLPSTRQEAAA